MCFLLWSGTVFLLHFIQNRIIDQTCLADVRREGDEGGPVIDLSNFSSVSASATVT